MVSKDDLIVGTDGANCVGALVEADIPDDNLQTLTFILGALFMKNVVSVFDLGTPAVGFGRQKISNRQYGGYIVVPVPEMTAEGTGPFATLSPTFNPGGGTPFL